MKRLKLIGSWKRLGVQAGLLTGLGLAFVGGSQQPAMALDPADCPSEGGCTFLKPNLLIVLDYSSSMNEKFGMNNQSRWVAAQDAIVNLLNTDNEYFDKNVNFALIRFGHDPSANPGSTIACDISSPKITDGQAVDHWWYDEMGMDKSFHPCDGDDLEAAVAAIPAPCGGQVTGIGTWTKGALDLARTKIMQSKADHPADMNKRWYGVMVMSDGKWTSPNGTQTLTPASEDPAITSGTLFGTDKVPVYFIYFGDQNDAAAKMASDKVAMAGGTNQAILAGDPQQLIDALTTVLNDVKNQVIIPQCSPGLPRFMVLLDASSSMLNVGGKAGTMGTTGWDQARDALSGANSLFDIEVNNGKNVAEDLIHLGLAVFGHNAPAPGEQKILVDYGPCHKDNFDWALNPATSCVAPGCTDPWKGPPITWTFQVSPPTIPMGKKAPFDDLTKSHMPKCDGNMPICTGSGTYTHLGLQLIKQNQAAYHTAAQMMNAPFPANAGTTYANILVTDGQYTNYSTDAQVQAELQAIYNTAGLNNKVTTYVIGFGDQLNDPNSILQLRKMACWGSGGNFANNMCSAPGTDKYFDANNQAELEAAFKMILESQEFDPCCQFNDCSVADEPQGECPDSECNPNEMNCGENQECQLAAMQVDGCDDVYECIDVPPPACGNGKDEIDPGEECDGANLNGQDCTTVMMGFDGGTLACSDMCTFDYSGCTTPPGPECNNGKVEQGEVCDGADLGGQDCISLGHSGGVLACAADCSVFDESGCTDDTSGNTTTTGGTVGTESDTASSATDSGTASGGTTTGGSASATGASATTGDTTDTDTGATSTGGVDDEGCGCSVDESAEGKARGLLGSLFGLGLAGFIRRRRRAA